MPDSQSHRVKIENGNWTRSNQQKPDLFSGYLVKTFTPNESSYGDLLINDSFDLISSEVPAALPTKTLDNLALLFNVCFQRKYFPSFWKVAEVIIIAKPGKP